MALFKKKRGEKGKVRELPTVFLVKSAFLLPLESTVFLLVVAMSGFSSYSNNYYNLFSANCNIFVSYELALVAYFSH